jgi:hypothetical protein
VLGAVISTLNRRTRNKCRRVGILPRDTAAAAVERRTIVLVGNSLTNKEVACEMDTSEQVVKDRVREIYARSAPIGGENSSLVFSGSPKRTREIRRLVSSCAGFWTLSEGSSCLEIRQTRLKLLNPLLSG